MRAAMDGLCAWQQRGRPGVDTVKTAADKTPDQTPTAEEEASAGAATAAPGPRRRARSGPGRVHGLLPQLMSMVEVAATACTVGERWRGREHRRTLGTQVRICEVAPRRS
jgi:hypothetical protein